MTINFLWQLITCSAKKFLPVTRKYFLHVVCDRKNSFIRQELIIGPATAKFYMFSTFIILNWSFGGLLGCIRVGCIPGAVYLEFYTGGWGGFLPDTINGVAGQSLAILDLILI